MGGSIVKTFAERYNRLPNEFDIVYLRDLERRKIVSKFQVLPRPLMHPGKCVGCLSNAEDGRKYVDLAADVIEYLGADSTGTIYICSFCVGELARILFPAPVTQDEPDTEEETPKAAVAGAPQATGLDEQILEAIHELSSRVHHLSVNWSSDVPELNEEYRTEVGGGTEQESESPESGSPESDSSGESRSVPSLDEILAKYNG